MPRSPKTLFTVEDCESLSIDQVWELYRQHINPAQVDLISSFAFGRTLAAKADGAWIYTRDGRRILDFTGGIGVLSHGHNHPRVLAVRAEFERTHRMDVHKSFFSPYLAALSHNVAALMPEDLDYCYFPNSGAEAVEGAIKMAYKYHGGTRQHLLHADISFHGKLLGAASVTGSPELEFRFPQIPHTHAFIYNDFGSVRDLVNRIRKDRGESDVYAIILEPMNASSLRQCSSSFLRDLRDLCDREGIVLIFDEVFTGWGKTGALFYFMKHEVVPDIVTTAKSIGGGKATISGYVARKPIFIKAYGNLSDATLHSTTYYGFGEENATAIEAINIAVEEDYPAKARKIYDRLFPELLGLKDKYSSVVEDVRGAGALCGVLFRGESSFWSAAAKLIPSKMFKDDRFMKKLVTSSVINDLYESHGILTYFGSNREIPLIISPPLVVEDAEIDYFVRSLDSTLKKGISQLVFKFAKGKFFNAEARAKWIRTD
jgi:putrescine aminotransferase